MSDMENEVMMDGIDDSPILPEGWTEDMDIFADDEPSIFDSSEDDAPGTTPAEDAAAPATEQPANEAEDEATSEEAPATEPETQETPVSKLRFKAKVDRNDIDVELDESELPDMYERAYATDRYKERLGEVNHSVDLADKLAAAMGYGGRDEMLRAAAENHRNNMLQELLDAGTPQRIAEDYVNRQMADVMAALGGQPADAQTPDPEPAPASEPAPAAPSQRDYTAEAGELLSLRPQLRGQNLPDEVIQLAASGKSLLAAYLEYEAKQNTAETERLRKENQILKQNAEAAARAPVAGTTGGGETDTKPSDPFLEGLNSDDW